MLLHFLQLGGDNTCVSVQGKSVQKMQWERVCVVIYSCAEAGITVARVAVALLFFLCLTCSHASSLTAAGHCYRGRFLVASSIPTLASG